MALKCLFSGHQWTEWLPWYHNAPRIVFASLEYMNDTRELRHCERCGKNQTKGYGYP